MIFKWIVTNGLSPAIKNRIHIVTNSPIGLGLYYGFLSTIPTSPAGLLFILWVQIIEKNSKKRLAAIKGFILGQLGIFIVIYYEPLFVALSMQSEFSSGILPIFLIHFFSKIQILWKIEIIKPTDERTELLIHFSFQLLNHFLVPNSRLVGLVKIFLFQCKNNNKILFLTCSVVGWLIGLTFFIILFVNFFEFVLVQVRKNPFIKKKIKSRGFIGDLLYDSKVIELRLPKPDRYMMSELQNYMAWILRVILFLLVASFYLQIGRKRSPILTSQLTTTSTSTTSEILTTELTKTARSAMSAIEETKAEIQKRTEKKKENDFCSEKNEADFCSEKSVISLFNRNQSNFSVFIEIVRKGIRSYFEGYLKLFPKIFSYENLYNYLTDKNKKTSHNPNIKGRRLGRFYDYEKETKTQLAFPLRFKNIRIIKDWWNDNSAIPKN